MGFEQNRGQGPAGSQFFSRASAYTVSLEGGEQVLSLRGSTPATSAAIRLSVVGGRPSAAVEGVDTRPGVVNDLTGNDPTAWRRGIPTYGGVAYRGLLPGVDLVVHSGPFLEYDFVVAPGTDPGSIHLRIGGAKTVTVDRHGNLVLQSPAGVVTQDPPVIYQEMGGARKTLSGHYRVVNGDEVRFDVGRYDPTRPLVIDPVVTLSTQVSGTGLASSKIAVDSAGAAYVTGTLTSASPANRFGPGGGTDAFVAKIGPDGTQQYITILGGSADDVGDAVAIDSAGGVILTGGTHSTDFPTTSNAFAPTHTCPASGCAVFGTAFLASLDNSGQQLRYSSYFGGTGPDEGVGLALGPSGNEFVGGQSSYQSGSTFPTKNAYRPGPCQCVFQFGWAARFDLSASGAASLLYSTMLTHAVGAQNQSGTFVQAIAVDSSGAAYLTGEAGPGFPTTPGSFDPADRDPNTGGNGGFLTKISPDGKSLVYSTHFGHDLQMTGVAVDAAGNAYLTGRAASGLPVAGSPPFQSSPKGGQDASFSKVDANGAVLIYSTYLGGSVDDTGRGIAVDATGMAFIVGNTASKDFPTVNPIPGQAASTGVFVVKVDTKPQQPVFRYSTTLTGSGGAAIAIGPSGSAYIVQDSGVVQKLTTLPIITNLSQRAGPTAGATSVTVTGTDLAGATSVDFGGASLTCGAKRRLSA